MNRISPFLFIVLNRLANPYLTTITYFFGSGTGTWGWTGIPGDSTGAVEAGFSLITMEARLVDEKVRRREVIIKITAATVVNLERNPIAPALPNSV